MASAGGWILSAAIKAALEWLKDMIIWFFTQREKAARDESVNQQNREQLEQAETDQERRDANENLANRLGRR